MGGKASLQRCRLGHGQKREKEELMAMIDCQGIKLAYEDHGVGKPAFLFVHGWACDRSAFAPQAAHFALRQRVVAVDLRVH